MNDPILEVKNLKIEFKTELGTVKAVDGVNLVLNKGETLALVGESGSGKSVTGLGIMRLISSPPGRIVSGEIIFEGENILDYSEKKMRELRGNRISMIFQDPMTSLNPFLKISRQLTETIEIHQKLSYKQAKLKSIEMLEMVGIPNPEKRIDLYPHQFSGGMRQRVMIAIALSCKPSILIADEPTTALDVTIQSQIIETMQSLSKDLGTSIIMITHDLGVVAGMSHRVSVMYGGRIVETGTNDEIFYHPNHPYTVGLLRAVPRLDQPSNQKLYTIGGAPPNLANLPNACYFNERCPNVMDICQEKYPNLTDLSDTHQSSCWINDITQKKEDEHPNIKISNNDPRQSESQESSNQDSLEPILKVENLKQYFTIGSNFLWHKGKQLIKAVDDISFSIMPHKTLGLVGESGCGKSTTLRTIIQLYQPTSGQVYLEGEPLVGLSSKELNKRRGDIQMIFQDPYASLNPRMTVEDILREPLILCARNGGKKLNSNEQNERIKFLLDKISFTPAMRHRYPHEFSGGQRQRIGIARALMTNPKIVLADEPVSALDVSIQAQILNLLKDLQAELGLTYLFISHDLSVVKYMSDEVAVMYKGRIVEKASNEVLYKDPKHPYTRALLSAVPVPDPKIERERKRIIFTEDMLSSL